MYFWNVNALARDLKTGTVSQGEKVKYYVCLVFFESSFSAFSLTLTYFAFKYPQLLERPDFFDSILYIIAQIIGLFILFLWGIYYSFDINKQGDNKDFVARFISLYVPSTIRFHLLYALLVGLPLAIIYPIAARQYEIELIYQSLIRVAGSFILHALLLLYVSRKIRYVSGAGGQQYHL